MQHIARASDKSRVNVVFTSDAATTGGFAFALFAGALIEVDATSTGNAVTLTFGARPQSSSTEFVVAADDSNSPITLTVQPGRCYALPDALFAASYVAATTGAGTATCTVFLKG